MPEIDEIRAPQRKCVICKALVDEEDLFCANCGAEVPKIAVEVGGHVATRETTYNFTCAGCGASMSYDASAQALRCPFCGSEKLEKKPDSKTFSPRRVVLFAVDKQRADQITRQWLGTGWLRPSDLSDAAVITKMAAVYVPYWVFTAHTATYWTADTSRTPAGARGDWFPLAGEYQSSYAGILVGASGALTPRETYELCPFYLNVGVPPEQVDLDNAIVEQFSVPRKYARPHARSTVEQLERRAVDERYVPGRSRNVKVNTLLSGLSSEATLLPVWMMAYQYKEKSYRFLINGQTGEPHGAKPISYRKILIIVGIVLAAIVGILICMGVIGGAAAAASQQRVIQPIANARTVRVTSADPFPAAAHRPTAHPRPPAADRHRGCSRDRRRRRCDMLDREWLARSTPRRCRFLAVEFRSPVIVVEAQWRSTPLEMDGMLSTPPRGMAFYHLRESTVQETKIRAAQPAIGRFQRDSRRPPGIPAASASICRVLHPIACSTC